MCCLQSGVSKCALCAPARSAPKKLPVYIFCTMIDSDSYDDLILTDKMKCPLTAPHNSGKGLSAAHKNLRLLLLPSGPDKVHGILLRRTQTKTGEAVKGHFGSLNYMVFASACQMICACDKAYPHPTYDINATAQKVPALLIGIGNPSLTSSR